MRVRTCWRQQKTKKGEKQERLLIGPSRRRTNQELGSVSVGVARAVCVSGPVEDNKRLVAPDWSKKQDGPCCRAPGWRGRPPRHRRARPDRPPSHRSDPAARLRRPVARRRSAVASRRSVSFFFVRSVGPASDRAAVSPPPRVVHQKRCKVP